MEFLEFEHLGKNSRNLADSEASEGCRRGLLEGRVNKKLVDS